MLQTLRQPLNTAFSVYKLPIKALTHLVSGLWLTHTFYAATIDNLGADPVEALLHFTGMGAFNLLLISLLMSPLSKQFRSPIFIQYRRLTGLWAATYALVHFVVFILFELQLQWQLLLEEIAKRPYITVGFAALVILTALSATSTKGIQRKMGRRWQSLHNWVYLAAALIALHFLWSVKSLSIEPIIYVLMVLFLLYARRDKLFRPISQRWKKRNSTQ